MGTFQRENVKNPCTYFVTSYIGVGVLYTSKPAEICIQNQCCGTGAGTGTVGTAVFALAKPDRVTIWSGSVSGFGTGFGPGSKIKRNSTKVKIKKLETKVL
jgi:hypothetical protein